MLPHAQCYCARVFFFFSCSSEDVSEDLGEQRSAETRYCNQTDVYDFLKPNGVDFGDITVTQDNDFLTIEIEMAPNWNLNKTYIYVGAYSGIPTSCNGCPAYTCFPNIDYHGCVETFTLQIPLTDIPFGTVVLGIKARVWKDGDCYYSYGWGEGTDFATCPYGPMFIDYEIEDCTGGGTLCSGFKTGTMAEWSGTNAGFSTILQNQFSELTLNENVVKFGCASATDSTVFNSGAAVLSYLPDTGPIVTLTTGYVNPTGDISSLLGELLTLKLNLKADANILGFSTADSPLGSQTYIGGGFYNNMPVDDVLSFGEQVLYGCFPLDPVELHTALVNINGNYSNGADNGFLDCPFD